MVGKFWLVEGADFIGKARDFAGGLMAEIAHHGDARTIAAKRKVEIIHLAHMRHLVEREGDIARPGMGDRYAF